MVPLKPFSFVIPNRFSGEESAVGLRCSAADGNRNPCRAGRNSMSSKRVIRTCQRGIHAALLLALLALASHSPAQRDPLVQGVDAIGITVSDMDRAMEFYSKVLTFEKISDTEGRPFPTDEHANDIVHRHTILSTSGADAAAHQLQVSKVNFVSSGVVANHNEQLGFRRAFLARDPDGHAIAIEEK